MCNGIVHSYTYIMCDVCETLLHTKKKKLENIDIIAANVKFEKKKLQTAYKGIWCYVESGTK